MTPEKHDQYSVPDPAFIKKTLAKLGDLQHRRAFYLGLDNPHWVRALDNAHAFDSPPRSKIDKDGYLRGSPWPEGGFLIRMAGSRSEDVASILARFKDTDDPYLQRLILSAAEALPSRQGKQFVSTIAHALTGPYRNFFDPMVISALIKRLAEDDEFTPAIELASAAYRPTFDENSDSLEYASRAKIRAGVEENSYQETLPAVVCALAPAGLKWLSTLVHWLEHYQELAGYYPKDSPSDRDVSIVWRPSIAPHEYNRNYELIGNSLVDAVRDLSFQLIDSKFATTEDVLEILQRSNQPLLVRIALNLVAALTLRGSAAATGLGYTSLTNSRLLELNYRHEYAGLASAVLPRLAPEELATWVSLVHSGPHMTLEQLSERATAWQDPNESLEAATNRYIDMWVLELLAAVKVDALPAELRSRLRALSERYGNPEHPSFPVGPMEFVERRTEGDEQLDLTGSPVDEVIEFVSAESALRDSASDSSPWRLEAQIEAAALHSPAEYAAAILGIIDRAPRYVPSVLSGLRKSGLVAISADGWEAISWLGLRLARSASEDKRESDAFELSRAHSQQAFISLVEQGIKSGIDSLPFGAFLDALAILATPPSSDPSELDRTDGLDPLTLSLNDVRARALFASIRLLHLTGSKNSELGIKDGLFERALNIAASHVGPQRDSSLAIAASYGRGLGVLIDADEAWMTTALSEISDSTHDRRNQRYLDILVTTSLVSYQPSIKLFRVLRPYLVSILARVSSGAEIALAWRRGQSAPELIGRHIVFLATTGDLDMSDEAVQKFFASATPEERASVIGLLGSSLTSSKNISSSVLNNARSLIDWRIGELISGRNDPKEFENFDTWVGNEKLSADWWLDHLTVIAGKIEFDRFGILATKLVDAAAAEPTKAVNILSTLLSTSSKPQHRYALVQAAPALLAVALDSGEENAALTARDLLERLGREGELNIRDLVKKEREKDL